MRKITTTLLLGTLLVTGTALASSLYAQGNQGSSGSMMGNGMMRDQDGGAMMGMMTMMSQMSRMVDRCAGMMSESRPNNQWRKDAPSEPGKQG